MDESKWQRWCDPWQAITLALDVCFYGSALLVYALAGLLFRESVVERLWGKKGGGDGDAQAQG